MTVIEHINAAKDTLISFEILPSMLAMEEIESGEYKIKYITVYKDKKGGEYTKKATYSLFCTKSMICCVDKMVKNIRSGGFKDPKQQLIIELSNLLQGVLYQVECGNYGLANKDSEYIKAHCKCCGCN